MISPTADWKASASRCISALRRPAPRRRVVLLRRVLYDSGHRGRRPGRHPRQFRRGRLVLERMVSMPPMGMRREAEALAGIDDVFREVVSPSEVRKEAFVHEHQAAEDRAVIGLVFE